MVSAVKHPGTPYKPGSPEVKFEGRPYFAAKPAVEAVPATYDILGLTFEQACAIRALLGRVAYGSALICGSSCVVDTESIYDILDEVGVPFIDDAPLKLDVNSLSCDGFSVRFVRR